MPNEPQQPDKGHQCLCAYIQPFTLGLKSDSGDVDGNSNRIRMSFADGRAYAAWAPPHDWATGGLYHLHAPGMVGESPEEYARAAISVPEGVYSRRPSVMSECFQRRMSVMSIPPKDELPASAPIARALSGPGRISEDIERGVDEKLRIV